MAADLLHRGEKVEFERLSLALPCNLLRLCLQQFAAQ